MTRIGSSTRLAGVMGYPLGHSLSPSMHNAAYDQLGLDWVYVPLELGDSTALSTVVDAARALDFVGFNVTMPYKQAVFALCERVDEYARLAGAANTFKFESGSLSGFNTDAPGLLESLKADAGFEPAGASVVIIGAGGAARAALVAMLLAGAADITVVARSVERADQLVVETAEAGAGSRVQSRSVGEAGPVLLGADLVINATPLGMGAQDLSPIAEVGPLSADTLCYDMVYGTAHLTAFELEAQTAGARYVGGLGMLVSQGALAVDIWCDAPGSAPRAVMRRAAEAELGKRLERSD